MPKNIVWTSVFATLSAVACLVSAVLDHSNLTLGYGLVSIASATLSVRER